MYVCVCNAISDKAIRNAVANGARTLADLQASLGVATCCGCCASCAESYLQPDNSGSHFCATEVTSPWQQVQA